MTEVERRPDVGRLEPARPGNGRSREAPSPDELVQLPGRRAPPGATVELLDLSDGTTLRTARWLPSGSPQGTVLICTGRGEFIEKYFEMARDLLDRRFAVVVFDWRGQGFSSRATRNARKGHVDTFDEFARDLTAVVDRIVVPHCPRPFFAIAHSMGGAVILHHARSRACRFERIVLSAPMIAIDRLPWPRLLHSLSRLLKRLGFGRVFVPQGGRTAVFEHGFEGNVLTTDRRRFTDMMMVSRAEPSLTIDAPTVGWLGAALDAMAPFAEPAFASRLAVPIMMVVPSDDRVVEVAAMERFAQTLKAGTLVSIPGARHEILMERDTLRDQFWAAFDAFVPGTRAGRPEPVASNTEALLSADARR